MYLPALIAAILAFLCFLWDAWEMTHPPTHRHALLPFGLALLVAALILQLCVQTGSPLIAH